ncbi:IclR family transcriptional regulator [Loktanella sp. S4079]|uniref:IclR family transcriptional regulator n=1 Tax=Loktanella sp. S4079 TaxID=579483 RepID=UPI0005FA85E7|nr:IclR family transcriptional regulator [Loktanella sp. S4079]KJZ18445.1 IclR family transcriptional regulator [Loktanella sp. S4079]
MAEEHLNEIDGDEDRKFVSALARGLDILRAFRPHETTLTNLEIATRTGLPKPTISRLTYTLCKLEYLVYSERTGTYRLGSGVLALGFGVLSGIEVSDRATDELIELCSGPNPHLTASFGERFRMSVIYTAVRRSQQAVSLSNNIGARLPLFHSAIGRVVLATMPEDERQVMLNTAINERPDDEGRIRDGLKQALEDYERYGFCTSFGGWLPEVNGVAAPVFSLNGDRTFGVNLGGPSFLVSPSELIDVYGPRILAATERLSYGAAQPQR